MMRSPRWLRPHTVKVINVLEEVDGAEQTSTAILERVKFDAHRGSTFGSTGRQDADTVSVVIDVNDLQSSKEYRKPEEFENSNMEFTLRPGDRIEYDGKQYEITDVTLTNPLRNAPEFIEVTAQ